MIVGWHNQEWGQAIEDIVALSAQAKLGDALE
jgi:hypothetical protein